MKKIGSQNIAIVGGGGYIGYHIGVALHKQGHRVTLVDVTEPDPEFLDGNIDITFSKVVNHEKKNLMHFIKASVTCEEDLKDAFKTSNANSVIHCASYGMSGKEQMPSAWDKTEEINIGGTRNVIKACCSREITSLVYTSTFNVIFGGQEIINGEESLPYFPLHRHVDHYSRTKSVAEQLILMADGKRSLRTCALRLAGVMGLKEKRHLPRIVQSLPYLKFTYKCGEGLVQFVSLQNVVQAHVKALAGIISQPDLIGGQAYFISDQVPINNFEYFRPLIKKLGYSYPSIELPISLIWIFTYLNQWLFFLVTKINLNWTFTPFLTPAEVYKTAVTHHFSSEKARIHFGYIPLKPNDISEIVEYFHAKKIITNEEEGTTSKKKTGRYSFIRLLFLCIGFVVLIIGLFSLPYNLFSR